MIVGISGSFLPMIYFLNQINALKYNPPSVVLIDHESDYVTEYSYHLELKPVLNIVVQVSFLLAILFWCIRNSTAPKCHIACLGEVWPNWNRWSPLFALPMVLAQSLQWSLCHFSSFEFSQCSTAHVWKCQVSQIDQAWTISTVYLARSLLIFKLEIPKYSVLFLSFDKRSVYILHNSGFRLWSVLISFCI